MATTTGLPLPSIPAGEHACFPAVSSEQRMLALVGYLAEGIAAGDSCHFAGSPADRAELSRRLAARGVDVDRARVRGALLLVDADQLYRPDGTFQAERSLAAIVDALDGAVARGFGGFRVAGHPSLHGENIGEVLRYEARLTQLVKAHACASVLCCLDRRAAPAAMLRSMLQAHPWALLGARLCRNHFHDPALGSDRRASGREDGQRELDWMINQLIRSQDAELQLREEHETLLRQHRSSVQDGSVHAAERLARALESRDHLLADVARQLSGPVTALRTAIGSGLLDAPVLGAHDARAALELLERVSAQLRDVGTFVADDEPCGDVAEINAWTAAAQ